MSKEKSSKCRAIRIRCYVDPKPVLEAHEGQLRRAIYIKHDDEGKAVHYHVNLILKSSRVPEEIRRWFEMDTDKAWCDIDSGTFESAITYYKHETDSAVAEGKKHYDDSDVQYFKCTPTDLSDIESDDCSYAILLDMVRGVPLLQIAEKYGKAFTRYYLSFRTLAKDIRENRVCLDDEGNGYNELGELISEAPPRPKYDI